VTALSLGSGVHDSIEVAVNNDGELVGKVKGLLLVFEKANEQFGV
jgi:hypothetical protein